MQTMAEQETVFNETMRPFFKQQNIRAIGRQPLIMFSLGIPPQQFEAIKAEKKHADVIELYRERLKKLTCGFRFRTIISRGWAPRAPTTRPTAGDSGISQEEFTHDS